MSDNGHEAIELFEVPPDPLPPAPPANNQPLDLNVAEQLVAMAKERRAKACELEVQAVLRKHHCALLCRPSGYQGNSIAFAVMVTPLDNTNQPAIPPEQM
jgi:hypothetical protein